MSNYWSNILQEFNKDSVNRIDGMLALKSDFDPNVYFNNLGVLYEKLGDLKMAKFFYIKSLGNDFFNFQTWKNFLDVAKVFGDSDGSELLILYFLQSEYFISIYLFFALFFSIRFMFIIFKSKVDYLDLFKKVAPMYVFVALTYFVNQSIFFHYTIKASEVHNGPSVIFKDEFRKVDKGEIVLVIKKNNGFSKVLSYDTNKRIWISDKNLISM